MTVGRTFSTAPLSAVASFVCVLKFFVTATNGTLIFMSWSDLSSFAPRTKAVFESIEQQTRTPVIDVVPSYLGIVDCRFDLSAWAIELDRTDVITSVSNREVMLRYVLSRAIVDQGSDIEGVEMWHSKLLEGCYRKGIRILHNPSEFVDNFAQILQMGVEIRDEVVLERAQIWADQKKSKTRKVNSYTLFNVDGQRGGKQAHWFMSARFFPAVLLANAHYGGLSGLLFANMSNETPIDMSRRLRNDPVYGLGWCIGDKACDLFSKWAIGTFRLCAGLKDEWDSSDAPLPMDQRIGRLMIRFGFMDEFFGVSRMMEKKQFGFNPDDNQLRPKVNSGEIPDGRWFLQVMEFRRKANVGKGLAHDWLSQEWKSQGGVGKVPKFRPQEVIGVLCKSLSSHSGVSFTPVEIDDQLMGLGGTVCTDDSPNCSECNLKSVCQANNDPEKFNLKSCYT